MAVKNKTDLQDQIDDLYTVTGRISDADLRSILTNLLDSFSYGINLYQCPLTSNLVAGDNVRAHNLYISVFNVFVLDSGVIHKPDFENIDDQNIIISWVGSTLTSPEVFYLAKV